MITKNITAKSLKGYPKEVQIIINKKPKEKMTDLELLDYYRNRMKKIRRTKSINLYSVYGNYHVEDIIYLNNKLTLDLWKE